MRAPDDDMYSDEFEEHGPIHEGATQILLTLSLAVWSCIWGGIWLFSGIFVALHFREGRRQPASSSLGLYEDDL